MAPVSPVNAKTDQVSFKVLVSDKEVSGVLSIETTKTVNEISSAQLSIKDGCTSAGDFPNSNLDDYVPGKEIEIKAGYHSKDETIFKGIITKHSISADGNSSKLELECSDKAVKMTVGRKNNYFLPADPKSPTETKDSDIIKSIIQKSGLSCEVEDTTYNHKSMVQHNATDWDFILTRADSNGLITIVDDGQINIKTPDTSSEAVLILTYGSDILSFEAQIDAVDQVKTIKGYAWDSDKQAVINATGKSTVKNSGNLTSDTLSEVIGLGEYVLQSTGILNSNDLKSWVIAKDTKSKLSSLQGEVSFQGNASIKPGNLIELAGIGKRFSGNVFVGSVYHKIENGQWTTTVTFGLPSDWYYEDKPDISAQPASGLLPSISGLQIGVVKQIQEDPDGGFRVLTKIPILQQQDKAIWARLATFYASNGAGSYFYPEVNDEVILGFLNEDPRYPVVLGSMFSKKNKSPESPEETNDKKGFFSKNKLELSFAEEDKIILIKTPGGNQITVSDKDQGIKLEDQNSNKVTMDSSGITIDSASNIKIQAKGNITMDAGGNLAQSAKGNVTVEGMQITNEAKTAFTGKGNATAELSASGQVTVKGGMVMIN